MKYLICSDIHGSSLSCKKVLAFFDALKCDYILLLGDILYHGPRNALPCGHDTKKTASLLNAYSDKIIACRGNCDAEVDQMMLTFPVMADYALVADNGIKMFCTHGHIYAPLRSNGLIAVQGSERPCISGAAVVFYGHTHVQVLETNEDGIVVCNPGSVSLPKADSPAGFAVYDDGTLSLYNMAGDVIRCYRCAFGANGKKAV